jgi:hypothetical protein
MNKKLIRLTESDLHRIVKESVNRILEAKDRRILDEFEEAKARLKAVKMMYQSHHKDGYPFNPTIEMGRDEDNYPSIMITLSRDDNYAIGRDENVYNDYIEFAKQMKKAGFTLLVGPLLGDVYWQYYSDAMNDMVKKHTQRYDLKHGTQRYDTIYGM